MAHSYPRWDGDVAGAFIERLCVALVERGHDVRVIAPSDAGKGGVTEQSGVRVERVRYASPSRETLAYRGTMAEAARRPGGAFSAWRLIRSMERAVRTAARAEVVDVVHAHWWVPGGVAVHRARVLPYIATLHGTDVALLRRSRLARWLARPVLRRAAAVTAVSRYLADIVRDVAGLPTAPVVQPMPSAIPHPGGPGEAGLVSVGRLTRQKRIDLLIRATALLTDRHTSLRIVGDGPERRALEQLAASLGIGGRVRFLGALPPDEVASAIEGADVFVFPARSEGYGLAAAEALGLGIPVVVMKDGGGVIEIVTGGAGAVAMRDEPRVLAAAIERLRADPAARDAARRAGNALRDRLTPARVAEVFESIYLEAMESAR